MKDESRKLAFWLLPASPAAEFFTSLVNNLAARYDAPPFRPHLTLLGTSFDDAFDFTALEKLEAPGTVELEVDSIQQTEKYTKTLFVRFKQNAKLSAFRHTVATLLGEDDSGEYDPHLSLMYKHMPAEQKQELTRMVELPFERVAFDRLQAAEVPATIQSPEAVHAWRTVWERSLAR